MKTEVKVIAPIVHLNGTSQEDLLNQREEFYTALQDASKVLRQMAPHGRDYYLAGPELLANAELQHRRRQEVLAGLMDEMTAEAEIIQNPSNKGAKR